MSPEIFTRLENRAKAERVAKSALVETLIQGWLVGEKAKVKATPPTAKRPSTPRKNQNRFVVNTDLFVAAESEAEAFLVVQKIMKAEKLDGLVISADKA